MHNLKTVPSQHTVLMKLVMKLVMSAEGFHKNSLTVLALLSLYLFQYKAENCFHYIQFWTLMSLFSDLWVLWHSEFLAVLGTYRSLLPNPWYTYLHSHVWKEENRIVEFIQVCGNSSQRFIQIGLVCFNLLSLLDRSNTRCCVHFS